MGVEQIDIVAFLLVPWPWPGFLNSESASKGHPWCQVTWAAPQVCVWAPQTEVPAQGLQGCFWTPIYPLLWWVWDSPPLQCVFGLGGSEVHEEQCLTAGKDTVRELTRLAANSCRF